MEDCIKIKVLGEDLQDTLNTVACNKSFCNTTRYVPTKSLIGDKEIEDLEKGEIVNFLLKWRQKDVQYRCEVICNQVIRTIPQSLDDPPTTPTPTTIKKRIHSETENKESPKLQRRSACSTSASQGKSSQASSSQANSSQVKSSQANSSQANSSQVKSSQANSSQANSSKLFKKPAALNLKPITNERSESPQTRISTRASAALAVVNDDHDQGISSSETSEEEELSVQLFDSAAEELIELDLVQIMSLAKKGQFPKKAFFFGKIKKLYTQRTQFFVSKRRFRERPKEKIDFKCKICQAVFQALIPHFSHLNHHLKSHSQFMSWLELFSKKKKLDVALIDDFTLQLIKYLISSNTSLAQIKNPEFSKLMVTKIPSYNKFRNTLLPDIFTKLFNFINEKLNLADVVTVVVDLWSSPRNADFIAIVAIVMNNCMEREIMTIGMIRMPPGGHTAENIKKAVEQMLNDYDFDKSKLHAFICDEGSNLVRLFGNLQINNVGTYDTAATSTSAVAASTSAAAVATAAAIISNEDTSTFVNNILSNEHPIDTLQVPESVVKPHTGSLKSMIDLPCSIEDKKDDEMDETYLMEANDNTYWAVYDIGDIDDELDQLEKEVEVVVDNDNVLFQITEEKINNKQYDLDVEDLLFNGNPISKLDITLGRCEIPHFYCACHKLHNSVNSAIDKHPSLKEDIKNMNQFNSSLRRCQELNNIFVDHEARLKLDNTTRWSSTLRMLASVQRAYKKGLMINLDEEYPVSLTRVEAFIQILSPAYELSLGWQANDATISDTIPGILILIDKWEKLEAKDIHQDYKDLCHLLVYYTKLKFRDELQSPIYQAAAILRVSRLKYWINTSFAKSYLKKGLEALHVTCKTFVFRKRKANEKDEEEINVKTPTSGKRMVKYFSSDRYDQINNEECVEFQQNESIKEEIEILSGILANRNFINKCGPSMHFWKKHALKMPILFSLFKIVSNICASSAYVERFFSIAGFVCDRRRLNMKDELVIMRSLLKTNLHVLSEMNEYAN